MQLSQFHPAIDALQKIAVHFSTPFYFTPEFWAVVIALAIGILSPPLSEWWRRRPEKSNLVIEGVVVTNQGDEAMIAESEPMALLDVGRLIIKNKGLFKAKSVEAYIENITEDGELREDFVPMPLMWTHGQLNKDGPTIRDIYPNQTVYLDIFNNMLDREMSADRSVLLAVGAGHGVPSLSQGALGESVLLLKLYQESGQVVQVKLKIAWNGRDVPTMSIQE